MGYFILCRLLASSVKLISIPLPFFIEASAPAEVGVLRMVAVRLSPKVYEVTSGQRRHLHLAAVFACNFANHMYALSSHILEKQGLF